jgi:hypothetical protein
MGPYNWQGPAGSGVNSNTNQAVNTTVAGNYTLTMTPPGVCAPITKTVSLAFSTFPNGGFTRNNNCTTYTLTNTGSASPAVQTYTIVGPGAPPSWTTTSSTSVVNLAPSTTYTFYQTVSNAAGCYTTTSQVVTTPAGPSPAFTAIPSFTQCFNGNSFTFTSSVVGTHTYNFSPSTGAPPTGNINPYGPVSFSSPGTYTVIHTLTSLGCTVATTSVVTINQTPTISVASGTAPGCAWGTATLVGTGGPGSLTWTGPNSYTAVGGGTTTINSFQTTNQGIYTLTANNNGCTATRTINLQMPAQPTATITNTGPYCQGATIVLNAALNTTVGLSGTQFWSNWCCWSTCCSGYSAAVTPTATTSSSGTYWFYAWFSNGCYAQVSTSVTVNPCVLPIELTEFKTSCVDNGIMLSWGTASEINTNAFTILRSDDGIVYQDMGTIPGHGNSSADIHYEFLDSRSQRGKTYYYKLRTKESNNLEADVGGIISSRCVQKNYVMDVYPNPATNELKLVSEYSISGGTIDIFNTFGDKVKTITNVTMTTGQEFIIDAKDMISGSYYVVIHSNETTVRRKVIIAK